MPLYEYLCRDCEKQSELLVRSDDQSVECPTCGSQRMMKLLSVPATPASARGGGDPPEPCGGSCACFPDG